MSKKNYNIIHKRSSVNGRRPSASAITYGEIAVNYAAGNEKLFIKNSENNISVFPEEDWIKTEVSNAIASAATSADTLNNIIKENEDIVTAALVDLDERIKTLSAETALSGFIETLRNDTINSAITLDNKIDTSVVTLSGSIDEERIRAISAETALSGFIDTLRNDTINSAITLDNKIDTSVVTLSGSIDEERIRAISAETALSGFIDTLRNDTINSAITLEQMIIHGQVNVEGKDCIITGYDTGDGSTIISLLINSNDKVLSQDGSGLLTNLSLDIANDGKTVYLKGKNNQTISSINTSAFVIDGMLDNVVLSGNILVFTFNTDAGKQEIDVPLTDFVDIYTVSGGSENYLEIDNYKVAVKVDVTNGIASKNSVDTLRSNTVESASTLNTAITGETTRATAAETFISGAVYTLRNNTVESASTLNTAITGETTRATAAETFISGAVYTLRSNTVESANTLNTAITGETTRATAAETFISGAVYTLRNNTVESANTLNTAITGETTRATSAETMLRQDTEESASTLYNIIVENERISSAALNYLNEKLEYLISKVNSLTDRVTDLENS